MIKISITLVTLLMMMMGCNKITPSLQTNGKFTIVDSSGIKPNLLFYENNRRDGYYPVYYLGKLDDTIRLGEHPIPNYEVGPQKYGRLLDFTSPDSTKMRILVDTSFSLSHTEPYEHFDEKQDSWLLDSTKSFKAIPIFIYNMSNLIIQVGHSNSVGYMVRQIKNRKGKWTDIEKPIDYYCLTFKRLLVVKPKQLMVAKLLRHEGNYKALCRLKFANFNGTVYSNTFMDTVNKEQFNKK